MNRQEDDIQIEKTLNGDTMAFAMLIEKYQKMAFTLAFNILLNREDAEEAAQDAFLKAFSALGTFKREAKFSTWLYRIVVNTSLNKSKRKKVYTSTLEDVNTQALITFPDEALSACHLQDQKRMIQQAMLSLKEDERLVITLYYLNELSTTETAQVSGLSQSNVKVLLHRGRQKLAIQLTQILKEETKSLL